ncbi:MAG: TolC family protein [Flavobacteriales bacterium]|nr:TolC family protein [Flavobacteriales bacterium]
MNTLSNQNNMYLKHILLGWLLIPLAVVGQESYSMSLQQAQDYAAQHSYVVRTASYDAEAASRGVKETITIGLPQVNGSIDYNNYIDIPTQVAPADAFGFPDYLVEFLGGVSAETGVPLDAPQTDPNAISEFQFGAKQTMTAGVSVSQLIFDGSYFVGLKAAKTYAEVMQGNVARTQRDVKAAVAEAYHMVLIARENVSILEESRGVLETTRKETAAMVQQGFLEQQDLDQIDLSLSDLANRINHAQQQQTIAMDLLKFQMGMPMNNSLEVTDTVDGLMAEGAEALLQTAYSFQSSIDYRVLDTQIRLMDLNVKNEKAKSLPSIGGFYNYQRNAQRDEFNFFDSDGKWYPIQLWGVQLKMPIFTSLRGVHRVAKAKVEAERARMNMEQAQQGANLEYLNAKNDYSLALATLDNRQQSLSLADRIYKTTQTKYAQGVSSSFELAQAHSQLISAQGNYISSMLEVLNAKTRLGKSLNQYE